MIGNDSEHLNTPWDVIVDSDNTMYVADFGNNRVQKYTRNTLTGTTVAGQANAVGGSSSNTLKKPAAVSVDWDGNIYVCDSNNHRIQLWEKGATSGVTIAGTGRKMSDERTSKFTWMILNTTDSFSGIFSRHVR